MAKKTLRLTPADYDAIDTVVDLKGDEFYSVVTTPFRGRHVRSIHVFARQPAPKELLAFENLSTKIRIRGNRTDFEGSPLEAYRLLYDLIIARVYDVPVGNKVMGEHGKEPPLDRSQAAKHVPLMMKRRALADTLGMHITESQAAEIADEEDGSTAPDYVAALTAPDSAAASGAGYAGDEE